MTDTKLDRAELITVSLDGGRRSAQLGAHHSLQGYPRGADGWADLGFEVEPSTPIVRFDRCADERDAIRFACSGPMVNVGMPAGTVSRMFGNLVEGVTITAGGVSDGPIRGLDEVSLDLYLGLAVAAGIPVERWSTRSPIVRGF